MDLRAEHAALREGRAFHHLKGHVWLSFTGEDRIRYLNGQLTALVSDKIPEDTSIPTCVLTAKGKLCALAHVQRDPFAVSVDADAEVRESLVARLERYIIADDVALHDESDVWATFHLTGMPLESSLFPTAVDRYGVPGYDVLAKTEYTGETRDMLLREGFVEVSAAAVENLRIENGVPRWGAELTEDTIPMEACLEPAIDFHKGCYLGQEIISRIRSIGRVNKQLRSFVAEKEVQAGAILRTEEGAEAGRVTSATYSFTLEKWIGLGYVKSSVAAPRLIAQDKTDVPIHLVPNLQNEDA